MVGNISGQSGNCVEFNGADDVTFDCHGNYIDGDSADSDYGIWTNSSNGGSNNTIIQNCNVTDFWMNLALGSIRDSYVYNITTTQTTNSESAFRISSGSNVTVQNITASSWSFGIHLAASQNCILTDFSAVGSLIGMRIQSNSYLNISDGTLNGAGTTCVVLDSTSGNTLDNLTLTECSPGIRIDSNSDDNVVKNSIIEVTDGIRITVTSSENNTFYNNIINSSKPFIIPSGAGENFLNTTQQAGTNIMGGNYIGGNYWTNSTGDGYSDTCNDTVAPFGICDDYYNLSNGTSVAIDWLPLTYWSNTAPNITLHSPPNASSTNENYVVLNATVYDTDNDTMDAWLYGYKADEIDASLEEGLVLLMHFNNDSSVGENDTFVYDWSGNENNGTAYNGSAPDSAGKFYGGFEFDGVDDIIKINHSSELMPNNISVSLWFKYHSEADYDMPIIIKSNIGSDGYGVVVNENDSPSNPNEIYFVVANGGIRYGAYGGTVEMNTWYHIVGTYDGTESKIYVNGVLMKINSTAVMQPTTEPIILGNILEAYPFNGSIDELAIYNRTLSPQEIFRLYDKGRWKLLQTNKSLPNGTTIEHNLTSMPLSVQNGMVLLMHFDNDSSYGENDTHVYDWSGMGNNGTAYVNNTDSTYRGPNATGRFGWAYGFDQEGDYIRIINNPLLNLSNFTISMWAYPRTFGEISAGYAFDKGLVRIIFINYSAGGYNETLIATLNGSSDGIALPDYSIGLNRWYLISYTYNNSHQRLYLNGVLVGNSSVYNGHPQNQSDDIYIGNSQGFNRAFNGTIDEIAIWNRSLSASEVQAMYELQAGRYYWKGNVTDGTDTNESQTWWFEINASEAGIDYNTCTPTAGNDLVINETVSCNNTVININDLNVTSTGWFNLSNVTMYVSDTNIENGGRFTIRDSHDTIWQNGNLTISGFYNLTNTTLRMNGTGNGTVGINVTSTGWMVINESSNITNCDTALAHYFFVVQSGSNFSMEDSYLSECGWADNARQRGLEINTTVDSFSGNSLENNYNGVTIYSDDNVMDSITSSNNFVGFAFRYAVNNTLSDSIVSGNTNNGVYIRYSDNSTFRNITSMNTVDYDGIYVSYADNNIFTDVNLTGNTRSGINFHGSSNNNILNDSHITGNTQYGIFLDSSGAQYPTSNTIYNVYFNNTLNVFSDHDSNTNFWNISLTSGTNIIGGSWFGGNFWTDADGNFSDNCTDVAAPFGICDVIFNITRDEVDWLPLTRTATPTVQSVEITNSIAYTNDTLTCRFNITSSGSITANVTWYNDNDVLKQNNSISCTSGSYCYQTLEWNYTHHDYSIICSVNANNSGGWSGWSNSTVFVISNYSTNITIENSTATPVNNQMVNFYANYTSDFPVSGIGLNNYEIGQVIWNTSDINDGRETYAIALADLDGEGTKDVLVGGYSDSFPRVFAYDSNGTFLFNTSNADANDLYDIQASDVNNDGIDEFAVGHRYNRLIIYNGTNDVVWDSYLPTGGQVRQIRFADMDGDNLSNDIYVSQSSALMYTLNSTFGKNWSFRWNSSGLVENGVYEIEVGDLDGDGRADDAVTVNYTGVFAFNESGGFIWNISDLGVHVYHVKIADLDNDGEDEVAVGTRWRLRYINESGIEYINFSTTNVISDVMSFDYYGDGTRNEIAIGDSVTHDIKGYNSTNLLFTSIDLGGNIHAILAEDVTDDGRDNIIAGDENGVVWILNTTGDLVWSYVLGLGEIGGSGYHLNHGLAVSDINNDAIADIAVASGDGYAHIMQSANCIASFNDSKSYNMTWNNSVRKWQMNRSFPVGLYDWNITCSKGGYESSFAGASGINVTFNNMPNITELNITPDVPCTSRSRRDKSD